MYPWEQYVCYQIHTASLIYAIVDGLDNYFAKFIEALTPLLSECTVVPIGPTTWY